MDPLAENDHELITFIKTQISNGISKDEIRNTLISQGGWNQNDLDQAFASISSPSRQSSVIHEDILTSSNGTIVETLVAEEKKGSKLKIVIVSVLSLFVLLIVTIAFLLLIIEPSLESARDQAVEAATRSQLQTFKVTADIYFDGNEQSFEGFCSDSLTMLMFNDSFESTTDENTFSCNDSQLGFAILVPSTSGAFLCIDNKEAVPIEVVEVAQGQMACLQTEETILVEDSIVDEVVEDEKVEPEPDTKAIEQKTTPKVVSKNVGGDNTTLNTKPVIPTTIEPQAVFIDKVSFPVSFRVPAVWSLEIKPVDDDSYFVSFLRGKTSVATFQKEQDLFVSSDQNLEVVRERKVGKGTLTHYKQFPFSGITQLPDPDQRSQIHTQGLAWDSDDGKQSIDLQIRPSHYIHDGEGDYPGDDLMDLFYASFELSDDAPDSNTETGIALTLLEDTLPDIQTNPVTFKNERYGYAFTMPEDALFVVEDNVGQDHPELAREVEFYPRAYFPGSILFEAGIIPVDQQDLEFADYEIVHDVSNKNGFTVYRLELQFPTSPKIVPTQTMLWHDPEIGAAIRFIVKTHFEPEDNPSPAAEELTRRAQEEWVNTVFNSIEVDHATFVEGFEKYYGK